MAKSKRKGRKKRNKTRNAGVTGTGGLQMMRGQQRRSSKASAQRRQTPTKTQSRSRRSNQRQPIYSAIENVPINRDEWDGSRFDRKKAKVIFQQNQRLIEKQMEDRRRRLFELAMAEEEARKAAEWKKHVAEMSPDYDGFGIKKKRKKKRKKSRNSKN